ncbi:alpha/beta hydrolase [Tsukamurella sp. 8F]|uniref:alpha/beta fold hydrolase n=1 Tax=unclassified Tsukamurella TaxID=2633480 RepID=UPI0023B889FD|nr:MULTISPECIES: alpha/beta hydrolase [unclassified Tsukamurella]MDF0531770.1 alpha/beta hydrolase [Tsukamurella sp. 8J]MDF0588028.1 alpha/beta hydrolase [Tsukamurella sp. 8F]
MNLAELPSGTVEYRTYGPEESEHPPVLFVHGVVMDLQLWDRVAETLGAAGYRCFAVTWPLGSHRIAWGAGADRTARGAAGLIAEFVSERGLEGCTLVAVDTGGAISQYLIHDRPELIGRAVLMNCDCFDTFPPQPFALLFSLLRRRPLIRPLMSLMRSDALRRSPLGFGLLSTVIDPEMTESWVRPLLTDPAVRDDLAALLNNLEPRELASITPRMRDFGKPVTLVWGMDDRCFTPELGRRLADAFGNAEFVEVPDARTFVCIDRPDAVVGAITRITTNA